jgi:hypothetical protein
MNRTIGWWIGILGLLLAGCTCCKECAAEENTSGNRELLHLNVNQINQNR